MQRWKLTALASAALLSLGLHASDASALALGRITIQSALGEPLRAEVELPEVSPAEAETLRTSVASPDAYRARGIEYNSALSGVRINVERRSSGRTVLTLRSDRPVNDPFVDLIIEANWATGRVVRDYTLLIDPPNLRATPATVTAAPQIAPVAQPSRPAPRPTPAPAAVAPVPNSPSAAVPLETRPTPTAASGSVTVRSGDTAGRIAAANKSANVSLDQMLVAMLRANPNAFVGGNVNRIRSGAVLDIPDQATQSNTAPDAARQFIVAQSKDFNEFRRKLAGNAPTAQVAGADRSVSGSIGVQVEESRPVAAPDRLTLSKGSVKGQPSSDAAAAEKIAVQQQTAAAEARRREVDKNIRDLESLKASAAASASAGGNRITDSAPAATSAASATAAGPSVTVPVVATPPVSPPVATASAALPAASTPASDASAPPAAAAASAPMEVASEPAPVASTPASAPPVAAPIATEEPGLFDNNPLLPVLGIGLLLLLAGLGAYKVIQRRRAGPVDSSFLESRLQPDSFFGASGGQRVDTNHDSASSSSMAYSPSQLDAGGDVDPVAEADVYLAYGRDLQAEEILKEALRTTPNRVAIHIKLLEIYAKRNDDKTFESVASETFRVTRGEGTEWERACELGRQIDPSNRLYQPGGLPVQEDQNTSRGALAGLIDAAAVAGTGHAGTHDADDSVGPISADDLDLDLDMPSAQSGDGSGAASASDMATMPPMPIPMPMPAAPRYSAPATPAVDALDQGLDFSLNDAPVESAPTAPGALDDQNALGARAAEPQMLDFDVDSLSFDVDSEPPVTSRGEVTSLSGLSVDGPELSLDDPLATKLALAEEFNAIGDTDGARALTEEVMGEATGELRQRAQRLLADMG